ncbi:ribosome small subunit-dependent GTPase A [Desulfofalx alkaliphila]|uniref:ribosome small subunit-dependent GTPase A n=1 Tax=Desulfofalx alkaliphila TaxID=105483 RepID=UPI0004E0CE4E|nr:ribosome small subunit-dependent GTPase A [Desulfofalx alkaliphila]
MIEGIVVKAYSGYYYVQDGDAQWICRLRGKFRYDKQKVLVGDRVRLKPAEKNTGVVYEVLNRRNELLRPPVANVDQGVITFAVAHPEPNLSLLDRFLVLAESSGVKPVICLNKADLLGEQEPEWLDLYRRIGYGVFYTSTKYNTGLDELRAELRGKISVFAGPSGVGKSSLLNSIKPGLKLKTGEISEKLKRGRHTTRHVELLPINGGLVVDTPGFSNLNLPEIPAAELMHYFPELAKFQGKCRFTSCTHNMEPQCAIKKAVDLGEIDAGRYNNYLQFLNELTERERRY